MTGVIGLGNRIRSRGSKKSNFYSVTMSDRSLLSIFKPQDGDAFYSPAILGPSTIVELATSPETIRGVRHILDQLEPDSYVSYLKDYLDAGLSRFGANWKLLEMMNVLYAATALIQPRRYLEIGVRRGRSMAMVLANCPDVEAVGFDMWMENYAGMENPGADFVKEEMKKVSPLARVKLIDGDSHRTVPEFLKANPETMFDLITVDGDHSEKGALQDLRDVLPRLSMGGVIVFDDISHPQHSYLLKTWRMALLEDGGLASYEFTELGYGVALGVRNSPRRAGSSPTKRRRFGIFG
jgi:predicted O-methyltransferase YrrM